VAIDARIGRAFVANYVTRGGHATLSLLDTRTGAVLGTARVGAGAEAVAVDAASGRVLVPNNADDTVSVVEARTGAVVGTIALPGSPVAVAVDERLHRAYISAIPSDRGTLLDRARRGIAGFFNGSLAGASDHGTVTVISTSG